MNTHHLISFLAIGLLSGWMAARLMRGSGLGLIGNLVVGVVGAVVGGWVFGLLGISVGGWVGAMASSVVGAVLLLFVIGLLKRV